MISSDRSNFSGIVDTESEKENEENEKGVDSSGTERVTHDTAEADIDFCKDFSQSVGVSALKMSDVTGCSVGIMEENDRCASGNSVAVEQEKELVSSIIADTPAITHDVCNQILPSDYCEMPYDILARVDSLNFCALQDEHRDGNSYCCGEKKPEVVGETTDVGLCYTVSSVQKNEIPFEISLSVSSPNNYCHSDVPKVILGSRSPIVDTSIEDKERKGEINSGCHMMHLHGDRNNVHSSSGQRDMEEVTKNRYLYSYPPESFAKDSLAKESMDLFVALRDKTHEKQQEAYRNIISTSADDAEMIQMKNNVLVKLDIESSSDLFPIGGSSLTAVQELSNFNLHCAEELPVPHQFHAPSNVVASGHSNSLSVSPVLDMDYGGYSCPRTAVDHDGVADNEGIGKVSDETAFQVKNSENSCLSTQITSTKKSIEEFRIVKALSEDTKLANIINDSHESMKILSEYARRTRSCFTKRARSSIWGSLVNVFQVFERYNLPEVNQLSHYGRQKARSGRTSRKCGRKRRGGGSLASGKKRGARSTRVRLKIKPAKQLDPKNQSVVVEEMVNVPHPDSNAYGNGLYSHPVCETPTADNDVEDDHKERPDILQTASAVESDNCVACRSACSLVLSAADKCDIKFSELNLAKNTANDHLLTATQKEIDRGATENVNVEPGTSPDSEVINLIPDSGLEERTQEDLGVSPLCSDDPVVAPRNVRALTFPCSYHKKGKKSDKSSEISNCNLESSLEPARKPLKKRVTKKKKGKIDFDKHSSEDTAHGPLSEGSNVFDHLPEKKDELNGSGANVCLTSNLTDYEKSASPTEEGCKLLKSSKSRKKNNPRSKVSDVARGSRGKACRQNSCRKKQAPFEVKAISNANKAVWEVENHPETENSLVNKFGNPNADDTAGLEEKCQDIRMNEEVEPCRPLNAWVSCDDCHKWRRIPAALADSIGETDKKWTCKDNMDKDFAECSIPQEKSNAAINEELDITDGSGEEDSHGKGLDSNKSKRRGSKVPKKASWAPIKSNIFLHRRRRTQTIDEVMVCHCKVREDGRLGCGEECLNRMLNIECVKGTCPCGDNCSNQQFQKRKYAKVKELKCGKKGYGLEMLEDISKGQFLIEYVGEVLDLQAYEARQKEYASQGHKHFYFMTLNGSEVIDACSKGNLGRFINHSCEPNCRTEKWIVNGEICIGLFALRDIKKGEEVTFDYNYVRVFGAAAKKCVCGSSQCRGFIGGDPLNSEVIVQSDSDDDYPEPVMVGGDGEPCDAADDAINTSKEFYNEEIQMAELSNDLDKMHSSAEIVDLDICMDVVSASASSPSRLSAATEESVGEPPSASICQEDTIVEGQSVGKRLSSGKRSETSSQTETDALEEDQVSSKSLPIVKSSHKSSLVKKSKHKSQHEIGYKMQPTANRSIKVFALPVGDGFGAVQEKLNELLDTSGGLSKRRDATRGYLKLLLLTAASGDNGNGETIQSNRDLSMILDALLKTKSRAVLIDIINKNGLRMLHNVMKKYRSDFKKIPILRKLLKVLEFLAEKGILTCDHISGGPPCPGMESFLESMLSLTEHDDKQVHRIARSFRDRWIPRELRKFCYMQRDERRMQFRRGSKFNRFSGSQNNLHDGVKNSGVADCINQTASRSTTIDGGSQDGLSSSHENGCLSGSTKVRKRKSRWDQPVWTKRSSPPSQPGGQPNGSSITPEVEQSQGSKTVEVAPDYCIKADSGRKNVMDGDGCLNMDEDAPPGFCNVSITAHPPENDFQCSDSNSEVVSGYPQEKFISRLPLSYGISVCHVMQYGTPDVENVENWVVAPSLPFHPFPPLPSYPRGQRKSSPHFPVKTKDSSSSGDVQYDPDKAPCTSGRVSSPAIDVFGDISQQTSKRARTSNDLGQRYFRQQKLNNSMPPPWVRQRIGRGTMGNNSRNGMCNAYSSESVGGRWENSGNNIYHHQQSQHQNYH